MCPDSDPHNSNPIGTTLVLTPHHVHLYLHMSGETALLWHISRHKWHGIFSDFGRWAQHISTSQHKLQLYCLNSVGCNQCRLQMRSKKTQWEQNKTVSLLANAACEMLPLSTCITMYPHSTETANNYSVAYKLWTEYFRNKNCCISMLFQNIISTGHVHLVVVVPNVPDQNHKQIIKCTKGSTYIFYKP